MTTDGQQPNSLSSPFHTVFAVMDQGFCLLEKVNTLPGYPADFRYLLANPSFEMYTGLHEVVGKTILETVPQAEESTMAFYDQVALTGEPGQFQDYVASLDVWIEANAFRISHQPTQIAVLFTNITERKRVGEALRQSEQRQTFLLKLSDALRPLSDPVDIQKTVTRVALDQFQADRCYYCEIQGEQAITRWDAIRQNQPSVAGVYDLESMPILKSVIDASQPFVVHDVRTTDLVDESLRQLCIQLQVISFANVPVIKEGRVVGVLCVVQNVPRQWTTFEIDLAEEVAERTWAGVERAHVQEALQLADRRKDEFLAMLSHELRNPLATLHNTLLLLNLTKGTDESLPLDRAVAMMNREVGHLNRMVDDLLDVSRISQGKIRLKKERIDLTRLVGEALEASRPEFSRRGQVLTSSLTSRPIWVEADPMRLTQVVRNLLTNAAKYTSNEGRIEVVLGQENRQAMLQIRDNGVGLAADQLQAIFEVFVQVSSSLDRPQGGLGLGLAVVRQLVELHGGSVAAESPGLGEGSTFIVKLPSLPDVPLGQQTAGLAASSQTEQRILVVDDNADLAMTTALLLRYKKYEVHTCLSGPEALEAVERLHPDVVLLDLGMPGMDGYETCRRLRELPWGRHGVIVALSGYGQEKDKKRTQATGFDGHLVKPINLALLTEVLTMLLKPAK